MKKSLVVKNQKKPLTQEEIKTIKTKQYIYRIISYEIRRRRNFYTCALHFSGIVINLRVFIIGLEWNRTNFFKTPIFILFFLLSVYEFLKIISTIIDMVKKEEFLYSYSSYKNRLTVDKLQYLREKLNKNLKEKKIRRILLELINTKNLEKRNYWNLDPIRWCISAKIAEQTIKKFGKVRNESNGVILSGLIANYKLDITEQLISINWLNLILSFIALFTTLLTIISKKKTLKGKIDIIHVITFYGGQQSLFAILEFGQILINNKYYQFFIQDIKEIAKTKMSRSEH